MWKGIFYAILMFLAKASVGLVLYTNYFTQKWTPPKPTHPEPEQIIQQDGSPDEIPHDLTKTPPKTPHLDAIIVGSTMIARGGFGFLVASEAQSSGTLSLRSSPPKNVNILDLQNLDPLNKRGMQTLDVVEDQIFLVIVWALVLCTIVGPIVSGLAVRRKVKGETCECGAGVKSSRIFAGEGGCHLCL